MNEPSRPVLSASNRARLRLRALATYDLFPRFSAHVRRLLYNPLGVLVLAALTSLLCGFFLHPQGFVLCAGVLIVVALGIAWPWLTVRGLHGSISFMRARAHEGERVEVYLVVHNRLPWPAWGLAVHDGFAPPDNAALDCPLREEDPASPAPLATIAAIPGRQTERCRWSFVPGCRGVYPLTTPRLTTAFPFGLWQNRRLLSAAAPLIVWPRTFGVGPVPLVSGDQQVEGTLSRNRAGSNGDVIGVRPFRRGDSARRIHWGQSARHDRLIVCELCANARPAIQLVLDTDVRVHADQGPEGSREWAIRIVASLARGWLEAGAQVAVVGQGCVLPAASGPQQLHRLLDGLARLPNLSGPALTEMLSEPACRRFRQGLQVIVTTDIALAHAARAGMADDRQHWVILQTAAFGRPPGTPPEPDSSIGGRQSGLTVRPWLLIERAEHIPTLLRCGWKEARHGF
jgi:uncharacterized protein (DUF58 family)